MKNLKVITLGLLASCLVVSGANAQGLIGERYIGFDGGIERLENGASDDGWGAGVELNFPAPLGPEMQAGTDLRLRGDYMDVFERDIWDAEAVLRAYMLPRQGFTPFIGAGFGWVDFDHVDSAYAPVEAGIQFGAGAFSIVPFYRYTFAFDSAVDDFWSAGATAVFWYPGGWGVTASVLYTDYDDIAGAGGFDTGLGGRLGLAFRF